MEDYNHETILKKWVLCFSALDFALNSPESAVVPDEIREVLEESKEYLEDIMNFYEEYSIEELQVRA
jgi:hypothetical protein